MISPAMRMVLIGLLATWLAPAPTAGTLKQEIFPVSDLAKIKVKSNRGEKTTVSIVEREGGRAVKVFIPNASAAQNAWPGFSFLPEERFRDWRLYDRLELDIEFAGREQARERVCFVVFYGEQIRGRFQCEPYLKPGRQKIVSKDFAGSFIGPNYLIQNVHVVTDRSGSNTEFYLHGIKLVAEITTEKAEKLNHMLAAEHSPELEREYAPRIQALQSLCKKNLTDLEKQRWLEEYRQIYGELLTPGRLALEKKFTSQKQWLAGETGKQESKLLYGVASSVDKVYPEWYFPGEVRGAAALELAQNETEALQFVLYPRRKLNKVNISVSPLRSSTGAEIAATQVEILPIGFVNTIYPQYPVEYHGWTADLLWTEVSHFDMKPEKWQGVWLEVSTKPRQPAGTYRGKITVTEAGEKLLEVPLTVEVWNFALPEHPSFPTIISMSPKPASDYFRDMYCPDNPELWGEYTAFVQGKKEYGNLSKAAAELANIYRQAERLLRKHQIDPTHIYRYVPPTPAQMRRLKKEGSQRFCYRQISNPYGIAYGGKYPQKRLDEVLTQLQRSVPQMKRDGTYELSYIYGFDEVGPHFFHSVSHAFGEVKKRWPDLQTITTTRDSSYGLGTNLAAVVDIWIPTVEQYLQSLGQIKKARGKGEHVWWYVCGGDGKKMSYLLEVPATGWRLLPGMLSWKFGAEGFLFYNTMEWRTNRREKGFASSPWPKLVEGIPFSNSNGKAWRDTNGDGVLLYPAAGRVLPTTRLKCIRDGIEDYEYLQILKHLATSRKLPPPEQRRVESFLNIPDPIAKNNRDYTREGKKLVSFRHELGETISALGGYPPKKTK